jgi:hypothetical protein
MGYVIKLIREKVTGDLKLRNEDLKIAWGISNHIRLYVARETNRDGKYFFTPYLDDALVYDTHDAAEKHIDNDLKEHYKIIPV